MIPLKLIILLQSNSKILHSNIAKYHRNHKSGICSSNVTTLGKLACACMPVKVVQACCYISKIVSRSCDSYISRNSVIRSWVTVISFKLSPLIDTNKENLDQDIHLSKIVKQTYVACLEFYAMSVFITCGEVSLSVTMLTT